MGYEPDDWDYILSTVCNAYFSDLKFEELVDCVMLSSNKEELDAAVSATIRLWEIVHEDLHRLR